MTKLPVLNNSTVEEFSFKSLADFARPIYMDNNATTQVDDDAILVMLEAMEKSYANPSGIHAAGQAVKQKIEQARKYVADFIGCLAKEVIFTSGGTEGINSVIESVMRSTQSNNYSHHFVTCRTEHGAVLNKIDEAQHRGALVSYLDVDGKGYFDITQLEKILSSHANTSLVSLMAANNETGTIHHNLFDAIAMVHKYGSLFHTDAVQIAGKLSLHPYIKAGTDFLTISGHKFNAPKGIGALYVKTNTPFTSFVVGGYQEYNRRAGTENVPGILALGAVAKKMPQYGEAMIKLHEKFITMLSKRIPSCIINGGGVPGTINVGFKYVHREAMVAKLSQHDLYASVGSACARGIEPSHVLVAMNTPKEYLHGSVRFSFSKYTVEEEIIKAVGIIDKVYDEIRSYSKGIV